ncbi:MAG: hypothetical protein ACETWK_09665 [Candidatus Aminicenantaceae bacterium]
MPAVNVLGIGMGIYVLFSVGAGEGNFFYEAMAREKDAPHRSYFVIVPYLTTALGGLVSNLFFGSCAIMGYVLCGSGDAVAEPVGTRLGKHPYNVPSLKRIKISERTLEGSISIFILSILLSFFFFHYFYKLSLPMSFISSSIISVVIVIVEAFSFHGADNFTLQVSASAIAYFFIRVLS